MVLFCVFGISDVLHKLSPAGDQPGGAGDEPRPPGGQPGLAGAARGVAGDQPGPPGVSRGAAGASQGPAGDLLGPGGQPGTSRASARDQPRTSKGSRGRARVTRGSAGSRWGTGEEQPGGGRGQPRIGPEKPGDQPGTPPGASGGAGRGWLGGRRGKEGDQGPVRNQPASVQPRGSLRPAGSQHGYSHWQGVAGDSRGGGGGRGQPTQASENQLRGQPGPATTSQGAEGGNPRPEG